VRGRTQNGVSIWTQSYRKKRNKINCLKSLSGTPRDQNAINIIHEEIKGNKMKKWKQ
jgi:predicted CopG family antitoxin